MGDWPANWDELLQGIGCEMCEGGRPDASKYGVRILEDRYRRGRRDRPDHRRQVPQALGVTDGLTT